MSVAGGVDTAFERAVQAGCGTIQIFTKNANRWRGRQLGDAEIARFRASARETGIRPLLAHDSYLINLGSPHKALLRRSRAALLDEAQRAEALGLDYLVIHPGSAKGAPEADCLGRIAESLDELHFRTPGYRVQVLLENTAGQGTSVGHRLEQLADVIRRVEERRRLGVCIDTCHLFAAGYDLRTAESYEKTMRALERVIGVKRVKAFHLNDCMKDLGCRRDRHEHIGKGFIGREGFRLLVTDPRFAGVPMVLETLKGDDGISMDRVNLRLLRRLESGAARPPRVRAAAHPGRGRKGGPGAGS
jgi:deoxyribonuclease-4